MNISKMLLYFNYRTHDYGCYYHSAGWGDKMDKGVGPYAEIMEIREYQEDDEREVIELWFKCNLVIPGCNPKQDIERKLKVDRDLFLVGNVNGKIIASVMGGYDGHRGCVNYLAVDPKYQRKGYGRKIMKAVEWSIKKKGCARINLQVRSINKNVIEFYQAIGYADDNVIGLGKRLEEDEPYNG